MAKHGKRGRRSRKFQRYLRGSAEEVISVGTLNTRTALKENFDSTVNERTYVSSCVGVWTMHGLTEAFGRGPIEVGFAHSDYTATEILEYLTQTGSWNETDLTAQEIAKRFIKRVGIFPTIDSTINTVVLNDGKPIHTKLGWMLNQGQTLALWVFNVGTVAVAVTVPVVQFNGHANLWPK